MNTLYTTTNATSPANTISTARTFKAVSLLVGIMLSFGVNHVTAQNCSCPGNLVQNASFENGTTSWGWSGGNLYTGSYAAVCEANSGQFEITNGGNNWLSQTIAAGTIVAGSTLSLGVYAGTHDPSLYHEVNISYFNSSWGFISKTVAQVNSQLPTMTYYSLTSTVPAGTHYITVGGNGTGSWLKTDAWCVTACSGASLTGIKFANQVGGSNIAITNGGTYALTTLNSDYLLEAIVGGTVGSVVFTVTGAESYTNTENSAPYNSPGTGASWTPAVGTYTVNVKLYTGSGGSGALCNQATYTFNIIACNNVTNGGAIGTGQTICSGQTPAPFTNITSPTGGSGALEYMWLKSVNNGACPAPGAASWVAISGASSATYAPGALTQTTCFMRCSRRVGCPDWDGESNAIQVVVNAYPSPSITGTTTICNGSSTNLTATGGGTYAWSTGATTASISVAPTAHTTYTVTVTQNGCSATATKTVTVNALPNASVAGATTICTGSSAVLTASGGGTYAWSNGASGANISVYPSTTTTYTVTVTGSNGCTKTAAATVTVNSSCANCNTRTATNTTECSNGTVYGFYAADLVSGDGAPEYFSVSGGSFVEYSDGTARFTGTATRTNNAAIQFYLDIEYSGRTITPGAGSPHPNYCTNFTLNGTDFYYYTSNIGTLTGLGVLSGGIVTVVNMGPAFQVGTGANGQQNVYGASGWFNSTVVQQPTNTSYVLVGNNQCDVNISLTGNSCATACFTPPTAAITTPAAICAGASASLTASGGGTYIWSNGATTATISVSPATTTTYTVTVTGSLGCTATASRAVTVNPAPPAAIAGTNTICNGQSTILTASGGGTYLWSNAATTAAITVNPTTTTTYTVTVTSAAGCTKTATATVTVNALPNAAITGTNTICNGQSTTLTASGGGTYVWSNAATTAAITVNPTTTTTYTVTVTNANGCTKSATRTVTVNPLPGLNITGDQVICKGDGAKLYANAATATAYLWSTGDVNYAIEVFPIATTSYTVTVTDANGCTNTASVTVTVNPLPNAAVTGTNVICNGQSTTLTATGGGTYLWSNAATTAAITVNPTITTTYTVTVTSAAGCTATANRTVTVNALPNANASASAAAVCVGQSSTVTATGGGTYLWNTGATTASFSVSPAATTTYTVTVTNAAGLYKIGNGHCNRKSIATGNGHCFLANDLSGTKFHDHRYRWWDVCLEQRRYNRSDYRFTAFNSYLYCNGNQRSRLCSHCYGNSSRKSGATCNGCSLADNDLCRSKFDDHRSGWWYLFVEYWCDNCGNHRFACLPPPPIP